MFGMWKSSVMQFSAPQLQHEDWSVNIQPISGISTTNRPNSHAETVWRPVVLEPIRYDQETTAKPNVHCETKWNVFKATNVQNTSTDKSGHTRTHYITVVTYQSNIIDLRAVICHTDCAKQIVPAFHFVVLVHSGLVTEWPLTTCKEVKDHHRH